MPKVNVEDHVHGRVVSYTISDWLDPIVHGALSRVCGQSVDVTTLRTVSATISDGVHTTLEQALSYVAGRQFRGWDAAISFLTKELTRALRDEIKEHHEALVPRARQDPRSSYTPSSQEMRDRDRQQRIAQIEGFLITEAVALLKAKFVPRPPVR